MLNISTEVHGEVAMMVLDGKLNVEYTKILEEEFRKASQQKPEAIGIMCRSVTYIDSSGLGLFVKLLHIARSQGIELVYIEPSDSVFLLLRNAKLEKFFKILSEAQFNSQYILL